MNGRGVDTVECREDRSVSNPSPPAAEHDSPTASAAIPPLVVDAKQLAGMLGLCERTVRTMDTAGKLPQPLRLNSRCVRWSVAEIEAWLAAGAPDRKTWEAIKKTA